MSRSTRTESDDRGPLRILVSAYACNPDEGSEPQTGWAVACSLALAGHEVTVITRTNNRVAIERAIAENLIQWPIKPPTFAYLDLPKPIRILKKHLGLLRIYYYLWQVNALRLARSLIRGTTFHVSLHITFGSCWFPSSMALLPIPFVWGPVGGGEMMPATFVRSLGFKGTMYEAGRALAKLRGRLDPFVRITAKRSEVALGTTTETVAQLQKLGCREVVLLPRMSLSTNALAQLGALPNAAQEPFRFICVGRLLPWKGFHMALEAFAKAAIPGSTLWIVGDGPARNRLQELAKSLGIEHNTRFYGKLSRVDTLAKLGEAHVLVHPSLHDSGSWVAAEAMAAGRPVICLNLGGPGVIVSDDAGYRVEANTPRQAVEDIATAMQELAADPQMCQAMGRAGRFRAETQFSWSTRGSMIGSQLQEAAERGRQL